MDTTLNIILLIVAAIAVLKAVWMLAWPSGFKATVDWWSKMPVPAARSLGCATALAGLVLIGLAIAQVGDPVIAIATVLGAGLVLAGLAYQWPAVLFSLVAKPFGPEGKDWVVRACGAAALALVIILFLYVRLYEKV